MDSKTNIPSFTVSLRGYDRVEVDEYLDSLADALGQVEDAQEQNRHLQTHIGRLNGRIKELEERINSDTPRTGAIVGERIGIMLRTAEETAADTVQRAEARAVELVTEAEQRVIDAQEQARVSVAGGQEQARRIEAAARAEAAEIISEAEARATARTRQIEQWAEQVVSHTRAEEARMLREQQEKRSAALAELAGLREQRDAVAATLADLRDTLGQALGLVVPPVQPSPPSGVTVSSGTEAASVATLSATSGIVEEAPAVEPYAEEPVTDLSPTDTDADTDAHTDTDTHTGPPAPAPATARAASATAEAGEDTGAEDEAGRPAHAGEAEDARAEGEDATVAISSANGSRPPFDGEAVDAEVEEPVTGELDTRSFDGLASEDDEFEAKLEAWVSEGAKHFRRM